MSRWGINVRRRITVYSVHNLIYDINYCAFRYISLIIVVSLKILSICDILLCDFNQPIYLVVSSIKILLLLLLLILNIIIIINKNGLFFTPMFLPSNTQLRISVNCQEPVMVLYKLYILRKFSMSTF